MYYFANWKHTDDGFIADLPENNGYMVLAEPAGSPTFGIFQVSIVSDELSHLGVEPVSIELLGLILAAKQYAPALAIARDEVRRIRSDSRAGFAAEFAASLTKHLALQRQSPYFLAAAKHTQTGYKYEDDFYWIVGYRPDRVGMEISWVSRDYHVYQDAVAEFDCDEAFLTERFQS